MPRPAGSETPYVVSYIEYNQSFGLVFNLTWLYGKSMKQGEKRPAFLVWGWAVLNLVMVTGIQAVAADSAGNPYQGIVDRNVFGLKPPPPPPDVTPPKPPAVKITLTGITTILGNKRALMKAPVSGAKPGAPTEQSYILAEGQRDGDIEVLQIDEKKGEVKINNAGAVVTLDWENNGIKGSAGPAPGAAPGIPQPPVNPFAPGAPAMKPFPTRALRLPGSAETTGRGLGVVSSVPDTGAVPAFAGGQPQAQRIISPDEQAILMAAQHLDAHNRGIDFPPAPPPIQELLNSGNEGPPTPTGNRGPAFPPRAPGLPQLPQMPQ
jgi:hypothetical protein